MAVFGAGAAAAALALIIVSRAPRPGLIVAGAALTGGAVMALFADAHSLHLTLSLSFAVGGVVAGVVIPIIQTTAPDNLLGRLMSLFGLATVGVAPLSIAAAALITEQAAYEPPSCSPRPWLSSVPSPAPSTLQYGACSYSQRTSWS